MSTKSEWNGGEFTSGSKPKTSSYGSAKANTVQSASSVLGGKLFNSSSKAMAASALSQSRGVSKYAQKSAANSLVDGALRVSKKELRELVAQCDAAREEREINGTHIQWAKAD